MKKNKFLMDIVIIGIGQTLRGDDGAGLAAVQLWQRIYPPSTDLPSVRVELAELPGLSLIDLFMGTDTAILVDAVRSGAKPGCIHLISESDLAAFESSSGSAHASDGGSLLTAYFSPGKTSRLT